MILSSICKRCIFSHRREFINNLTNFPKSFKLNNKHYNTNETNALLGETIPLIYSEASTRHFKGPPVIVMHGLLGDKSNWTSFIKEYSSTMGLHFYAVDARNHGSNYERHTKEFSYDLLAKDIIRFIDEFRIHKAVLMGHSMGGRAMMAVALYRPEIVHKLIVIDISPIIVPAKSHEPLEYMKAMKLINFGDLDISQARRKANQELKTVILDPFIRMFLLKNLYQDSNGKVKWKANLDSLIENYESEIFEFPQARIGTTYEGETHFIYGSLSDHIKIPHQKKDILSIFPTAEFHKVNDAGHYPHIEEPYQFKRILYPILRKDKT